MVSKEGIWKCGNDFWFGCHNGRPPPHPIPWHLVSRAGDTEVFQHGTVPHKEKWSIPKFQLYLL